jgi:hypothetical protein
MCSSCVSEKVPVPSGNQTEGVFQDRSSERAQRILNECFALYSSIETDYVVCLMEGDLTGAT